MDEVLAGELKYYAWTLSSKFKELLLPPTSDAHFGNPMFSKHHFLRHIDTIKKTPNMYTVLNGDLCESTIKCSKGDIFRQVGTPQDQRDWIIEHLMPIKHKILGMTCLTDDTLVLSDSGWKNCYELTDKDKVLSLNLITNEAEYSAIRSINIKPWFGDVIEVGGKRQSQCLTPDHWVLYWNDYKQEYAYRQAGTLPNDLHHICIPIARPYKKGDTQISDDEIMFLAWIITEGHISTKRSRNPVIEITQSKKRSNQKLEQLFKRLGLTPSIHCHKGRKDRVNEADWVVYYFPFEQSQKYIDLLSGKKEVPRFLLNLPYSQLKLLYETLLEGDGVPKYKVYYTANRNLALQVTELCLKLGYGVSLITRKRTQKYTGYRSSVETTGYTVKMYNYSNSFLRGKITKKYQGNVFCLSVSSGNFMAMRNGHPFFTGNTGNHEGRIYNETGIDISKDIAVALGVPYRPEGLLIKISFGDNNNYTAGKPYVYFIYFTHGYGGARTKSSKAIKVERTATWIHANCYIMSHDHVVNVAPDVYLLPDPRTHKETVGKKEFDVGRITAHRKMLVKTNAYLKFGGYAEMLGFPPTDLAVPIIKFKGTGKPRVKVEV